MVSKTLNYCTYHIHDREHVGRDVAVITLMVPYHITVGHHQGFHVLALRSSCSVFRDVIVYVILAITLHVQRSSPPDVGG